MEENSPLMLILNLIIVIAVSNIYNIYIYIWFLNCVLLFNPDCPQTCDSPHPFKCWDCRCAPTRLVILLIIYKKFSHVLFDAIRNNHKNSNFLYF
jgi:hypothetical protein